MVHEVDHAFKLVDFQEENGGFENILQIAQGLWQETAAASGDLPSKHPQGLLSLAAVHANSHSLTHLLPQCSQQP